MPKTNLKGSVSLDDSAFSAGVRRVKMASASLSRTVGKGFKTIGRTVANVSKSLAKFATIAAGITFAAATAGAYKLAKALKGAFDTGGALSDLSTQTGIAVKELAILQVAFKNNGLAAEKVGPVINKMQKSINDFGNGLSTQVRAFDALGISFDDLEGKSPLQQFEMIQKALMSIKDTGKQSAIAMDLFSRSGAELKTLFADGNAIQNASKTLGSAAQILQNNAERFDRISDLLGTAGTKLQGLFLGLAEKWAPRILEVLEKFNSIDFAQIGQNLANNLNFDNAIDLLLSGLKLAGAVFTNALTKGLKVAGILFYEFFKSDIAPKIGASLSDALLSAVGFVDTSSPNFGMGESVADQIKGVISDNAIDTSGLLKDFISKLEAVTGPIGGNGSSGGSGMTLAEEMEKERLEQKARIARENPERSRIPFFTEKISQTQHEEESRAMKRAAEIAKLTSRPQADAFGNVFHGLNQAATMQLDRMTGVGPGTRTALTQGPRTFGKRAGAISRANMNGLAGQGFDAVRKVGAAAESKVQRRDHTIGTTNERLTKTNEELVEQTRILKKGLEA